MKAVLLKTMVSSVSISGERLETTIRRMYVPKLGLLVSWSGKHFSCIPIRNILVDSIGVESEIEIDDQIVDMLSSYNLLRRRLITSLGGPKEESLSVTDDNP